MFFESDDPVASLARSWNGTWRTIGSRAGSTGISSGSAVLGVVDHEHSGRQHELLAEEGEVGPVERDQHVEMIAVGERLVLADPHAARRLAAANLRPERLQDGGMETLGGRRRDEQLTARDDAVAPDPTMPITMSSVVRRVGAVVASGAAVEGIVHGSAPVSGSKCGRNRSEKDTDDSLERTSKAR